MPRSSSAKKAASNAEKPAEAENDNVVMLLSDRLKAYGVDTDVMAEAAKDRAADLQKIFLDELKERPIRTLGAAAAVGLVLGFLVSR